MLCAGLVLSIDPLSDAVGSIGSMNPDWLLVAVGLEIASCLAYVVSFRWLFERAPTRRTTTVAWAGLGAGAVLPAGNVGSATASGWLLHRDGVPTRRIIERSTTLLLLINAVGVAVSGLAGALLLIGWAPGPHDLARAGLPVLACILLASSAVAIPAAVRRVGARAPDFVQQLASGISDIRQVTHRPYRRVLGAAGYVGFDMAALWAACAATGHPPSAAVLVLAYNVGYLASIVPVPAGIALVDGGLAGALILYGAAPTPALDAVLVYHAIAIWVPALGGLSAWMWRGRKPARVPTSHQEDRPTERADRSAHTDRAVVEVVSCGDHAVV